VRGWFQQDIAQELGVSQATVWKIQQLLDAEQSARRVEERAPYDLR